jgi:hypothetical protein
VLLQKTADGTLVEILDLQEIIDPSQDRVMGRVQSGQEEQDPESVQKQSLNFPSGESLPRCWIDPDYRQDQSKE